MVKCIVIDLDDTLWSGTLDANDDVKLNEELLEILKSAYRLGIVLAIASKNDYCQAHQKIVEFGIENLFYKLYISWDDKYKSIRRISEDLNIGVEHILLIDDSEMELAQALYYFPSLQVLNSSEWRSLSSVCNNIDPESVTMESLARNNIYRILQERKHIEGSMSREDFLSYCKIEIACAAATKSELLRVSELLSRTNQMNLNNHVLSVSRLEELYNDPDVSIIVVRLRDVFADYGIVGTAITQKIYDTLHILSFAVSCKVEGRDVGKHLLDYIVKINDGSIIAANYIYNSRNKKLQSLFVLSGFIFRDNQFILGSSPVTSDEAHFSEERYSQIAAIIRDITNKEYKICDNITEDLDSVTFIMLIAAIELEFNISINLASFDVRDFNTINRIALFIEKNRGKGNAHED